LDLAITHLERPAVLLRNDTHSNRRYIGVELRTRSRIPPIGGRVIVKAGEREHSRSVQAGGSYLASPDSRLLFGLVDHEGPVDVEVRWPDGTISSLKALSTDRYWVLGDDGSAREGVAR
ncbi:MAG TPA: ASPIC/UnbV domain-containing protein, partial [Pirellulaceae bacterium]|nr:ASPIC/UnbV domain-containing protein [Pirellulaceae bacterium]